MKITNYVLAIILVAITVEGRSTPPLKSFELSCDESAYLSVLAETFDRKRMPTVSMILASPSGKIQGEQPIGASSTQIIPNSQYGIVAQVPDRPYVAKAIGVCDAEQGAYVLTVMEHGNEKYRLKIVGSGEASDRVSQTLYHVSREGGRRMYKFIFHIENHRVLLSWLDRDGNPTMRIENGEW